ncbi:hypothetical protein GJ496_011939 [Pomphorhynchus laevis]|nr:hypothetical protein GJ496_011939 [Pomphorhynchus laevis]
MKYGSNERSGSILSSTGDNSNQNEFMYSSKTPRIFNHVLLLKSHYFHLPVILAGGFNVRIDKPTCPKTIEFLEITRNMGFHCKSKPDDPT